jgi:hypothetical protein
VSLIAGDQMRRSRRGGSEKNWRILGWKLKPRRQGSFRWWRRNERYRNKQNVEFDVANPSEVSLNLIGRVRGRQQCRFG